MTMRTRRRGTQGPPGLYVHSSPPAVLPPHPSVVRQWLRGGDVDKLESVVIQGQGHKLLGEYASDLKVRAFLKTIPAYLARIDMVHEAAAKGNLTDLKTLLKHNSDQQFPRKKLASLALSKDHSGTGLLHKAVYHEDKEMARWLVDNYPATVTVRDREGRTPLHYCGRCRDPDWMWSTLRQAGADSALLDLHGRTPTYYMEHPQEAKLPTTPNTTPGGRFTSGGNALVVKPANIRIWIHDRDLGRLRDVIWEGYGDKLRTETSQHPSVKQFLSGVAYVMATIKDVHTAAVNNDLILLRKRTEDPVPREILLAKDRNGLTPLHKAAGLGHEEVIRAVLSACPEALSRTDREGRTALHYAAAAKGSGTSYDTLLEYGAEENTLDKKGKPPSHYLRNPKEIDQNLLTVIPDAPRAGNNSPPFWDWNQLWGDGERDGRGRPPPPPPALSNNGDSAFEDMGQEDSSDKQSPHITEIPADEKEEIPRPGTYDLDADEGVEEEEGEDEKEKGYNADTDELEGHYEAEYAEVDPEYELTNEPKMNERGISEQTEQEDTSNALPEEGNDRTEDGEKDVSDGHIGRISPEAVVDQDDRVRRVVASGNIEQLAALVLSGEGQALAKHRSGNPDVQVFINNIPIYQKKIEKVHTAARQGNLRELQSALDRRKFSLARESGSSLRLTPLHVAVLYGRTAVVRFLGSRFPETLHAQDAKGRSPLHYAATLPDNGHYFGLLQAMGADKNLKDLEGKTAEDYLNHQDNVTYEQLLADFEGQDVGSLGRHFEDGDLSDKADDTFSARRENDDVEKLNALERCFKLIQDPFDDLSNSSLLRQFLTEDVFNRYKSLLTRSDHSLLDLIRPGMKQIFEKSYPPTESPIVLPDYESFFVFQDFVTPIIRASNGLDPFGPPDPHPESVFWSEDIDGTFESLSIDPSGKILQSCSVECSRNLKDMNFPKTFTLKNLEVTEANISAVFSKFYCSKDFEDFSSLHEDTNLEDTNGVYCTLNEILEPDNEIYKQLEIQNLLEPDLFKKRKKDKHWPTGRGVHIWPEISAASWINVQEHIKIKCSLGEEAKGRIGVIFKRLSKLVYHLEENFEFERDEFLGYLATDPQLVGNGVKFHAVLRLPHLGSDLLDLRQLCSVRGLLVESLEGKDEFRLSNRQTLGITELVTFREFSRAVSNIIELEKSTAKVEALNLSKAIMNFLTRKK